MTALQRLAEALEVEACRASGGSVFLNDTRHDDDGAPVSWWRTYYADDLRTIAALMLVAADELDAQTPEVTHG